MSHIAVANLFLESFSPIVSAEITRILLSQFDSVTQTRKGRVWEIDIAPNDVNLTLSVAPTKSVLHDVQDNLLELGFLPEDYPECIIIVSARGRSEDLDACSIVCDMLHQTLECVTRGATLCS